ncbi:autotransporter domain-containing protein [Bradyrhizobium genosp. L]|uniref:autotransporter family protein n=1 Tax=Bradyrhizobium genosp. L TaxID=83637 RepID=UPI0018A2848C|nr:autotransporter outer membrane beta-barrel domain-containing protein [Bradyrhizobium genosp. L]QPF86110.1 autotransporter domain-containing protein [Bradyrhizobium genosp. L]
MPNSIGRGLGARKSKPDNGIRAARVWSIASATIAATWILADSPAFAQTADNPIELLFVGNSFTHGRYPPALNYNAGPGNSTNPGVVHDLLCPSLTASGACSSGPEAVAPVTPTSANTPGGTLPGQLTYLQNHPSSQYSEVGPFSGVAGVFLQFTKEAGLHYDVSLVAVSSATLTGYLSNAGSEAGMLPLIANSKWNQVVMQDQSFRPLPTTVMVNGVAVPTRGNPSGFVSGMTGLVNAIDAADASAGKSNAAITLEQTQPLASYGYTSSNPSAPLFGSSTPAQNGNNPAYAPYVGAANPIAQMASDLHNAYSNAAAAYNAANPTKSNVSVALSGDAWVSAINLGIAVQNPYLANNPANQINLWDSNPLTACCTTPIGYHPSAYGAYLDAMTLFYKITGIDPVLLASEANPNDPAFASSAANALGISASTAQLLAIAAADTVRAGGPVSTYELQVGTIWAPLGGSSGLIKDSSGLVTLLGANTYTGATTIAGGILQVNGSIASSSLTTVNAGAALIGTGTVGNTQVNSSAMFAPGNGTAGSSMTVSGNLAFQSGAIYLVQVGPSAASLAKVTGTATLGGGTVNAFLTSGNLAKQYTILTASGGISGTFATTVTTNLPGTVQSTLSYDANDVFLNLGLNYGASGQLNGNQQAVGNALGAFFNRTGSIPLGFGALTPGNLSQASGESATGSQQTTFDAMTQFMGILTDPFADGRGNVTNPAPGYTEEATANAYAAKKNESNAARDAYAMFTKAPIRDVYDAHWSVWAAGFGGSQTTDGNATLGSSSATSSIAGTAVGADYRFSPFTVAGFALAGGGTSFSVAGAGSGRSDLFQAGAFVRHTIGQAYVTGTLAYGWQDITTDRTIAIAGIDHLRAEFNANTWSGRLEGGYRFVAPWIGGLGITPYAAGQFTSFDLPGYAEQVLSGSGTFALAYGARDVTDTRSELGIRTDKSFAAANSVVTLRGRIAWAHDYNPDRTVAATFQSLPGASFVVGGAAQARDAALTTAGVEQRWTNGFSLAGTFEGEFSNVTQSYAGKVVARYTW